METAERTLPKDDHKERHGVLQVLPIASLFTYTLYSFDFDNYSIFLRLYEVIKSFLFIIRKLNSAISVEDKNAWSNMLQVNIYLHRQSGSNLTLKKRRERSSHFTELIVNNQWSIS